MSLASLTPFISLATFLLIFATMAMVAVSILESPHDWFVGALIMATITILFVIHLKYGSTKHGPEPSTKH